MGTIKEMIFDVIQKSAREGRTVYLRYRRMEQVTVLCSFASGYRVHLRGIECWGCLVNGRLWRVVITSAIGEKGPDWTLVGKVEPKKGGQK